MLIKEYMTPNPITINEDTTILEAAEIMKRNRIRRLLIMTDKKLVGLVTDRDLRSAAPSQVVTFDEKERVLFPEIRELLANLKVKDIMSCHLITVDPEETIVRAAALLLNERISGMPVVDEHGALVGIITQGDLFKALVDFSGAKVGNITFGFEIPDTRPGFIKEVADVIRAHEGRLASILTSNNHNGAADSNTRRVYVRIRDLETEKLVPLKKELETKLNLLYMVMDQV